MEREIQNGYSMKSPEQFAKLVEAMGLEVEIEQSALSESAYVAVSGFGRRYKVRISTHETRPTYGRLRGYADFEVGTHQDADGNWKAAIRWLATQTGRKPVFAIRSNYNRRGARLANNAIMHLRRAGLHGEELIVSAWGCASWSDFWTRYVR